MIGLKFLFLFFFSISSAIGGTCSTPLFNFCSITIGGDDEINVFKKQISGSSCALTDYKSNPPVPGNCGAVTKSADGCIKFTELVDRNDNQWHDKMMSKTSDPCHVLLISGHHDASGSYSAKKFIRSRYIYSDQSYDWENGEISSPGPRLDIANLVRANPVCGDVGKICNENGAFVKDGNKSCFKSRTDNHGDMLLGSLLAVYIFACNTLVEGNATTLVNTKTQLPSDQPLLKSYSFAERTKAIFNRAIALHGFQHLAPASVQAPGQVLDYLQDLKKTMGTPSASENFYTEYLNNLSVVRTYEDQGGPLAENIDKILAVKSDMLGKPLTIQRVIACSPKTKSSCSIIRGNPKVACKLLGLDATVPSTNPKHCSEAIIINAQCSKLKIPRNLCNQEAIYTKLRVMDPKDARDLIPAMIVCTEDKTERLQKKSDYCSSLGKSYEFFKLKVTKSTEIKYPTNKIYNHNLDPEDEGWLNVTSTTEESERNRRIINLH